MTSNRYDMSGQTLVVKAIETGADSGEKTGTPVGAGSLGEPESHIADASVAHALADSFDDEESEAALDALGGKINAILAVLEAHGLVAES